VVAVPSFSADCLETLEEIGIRGREEFLAAGGEELRLVPCLNSSPEWIKAMLEILAESTPIGSTS
jgi:ferrochelatase